jgi:hypothetical protein
MNKMKKKALHTTGKEKEKKRPGVAHTHTHRRTTKKGDWKGNKKKEEK